MQRDTALRPSTISPAASALRWPSGRFGGSPWSRDAALFMAVLLGLLFVLLAVAPRIPV
jgi:hypothetical protein